MNRWRKKFQRFLKSEDGPTAVEYAIMMALIIVGAIAALSQFGTHVSGIYSSIAGTMP